MYFIVLSFFHLPYSKYIQLLLHLPRKRGMEEHGSEGLFKFVQTEAAEGKFLGDVDFFCISVRTCMSLGIRKRSVCLCVCLGITLSFVCLFVYLIVFDPWHSRTGLPGFLFCMF
jgi:hypothetical protein